MSANQENSKTCIPFFGLDREFAQNANTFLARVEAVCLSGSMLQGKETKKLEEECKRITERKHAIAVNSCTDALTFSLLSAGIGSGDEVLVTSYSFIASASAILRVGAKPIFLDIDTRTYMMNFQELEKKYSRKVKALIAVHLFGQMLDISALRTWCSEKNIFLVEDSAQALGACYDGIPAGSMGDYSCFSFDPTKVLGAYGSGGMVLTNDDSAAEKLRKLRYHGKNISGDFVELGFNSQIPEIQASILNSKLEIFPENIRRRQDIAKIYQQSLQNLSTISLPIVDEKSSHVWHKFAIRAKNRNGLANYLKSKGIETRIHYSKPMPLEPLFRSIVDNENETWPNAMNASKNTISLPIYPELTKEEASYTAGEIQKFYQTQ